MKITIFNLLNKEIRQYNLKELLEEGYPELKEILMKLEENGIEINNFSGKINLNNLEEKILSILFKGWELIDARHKGNSEPGHPDFILQKGDRKIYCEWKSNTDGLRLSQLRWMLKHNGDEVFIIWLEDSSFKDILKISEEELREFIKLKISRIAENYGVSNFPKIP